MRILHTSDWHLGRSLHGKKRYEEFTAFLDWLSQIIVDKEIDILLVAGDIFDTGTPSNKAQELYYSFLKRVSSSSCQHVVVIGGNHDSPTFLNAPKEVLKALNVFVVGAMTESLEDEVIVLTKDNQAQAIICAVPYLREKDIRKAEAGETIDDKNAKLVQGVQNHYAEVCKIAETRREELNNPNIPIIAMGHLFTVGGKTSDGVRDLYVGSLTHIHADKFPSVIDYFALGHLHVPQVVNGKEHIRYSGSPIPMGFGEANQKKRVFIIDFTGKTPDIQAEYIPVFQKLVRVHGTQAEIVAKIEGLKLAESDAWLEIEYTGKTLLPNFRQIVDEALVDSKLESLKTKNRQLAESVNMAIGENETLDDLSINEVFKRCLDAHNVAEEERDEYVRSYNEIVKESFEEDGNAE